MYNPRSHTRSPIAAGRPLSQQQQQQLPADTATPPVQENYRTPRASQRSSYTFPQTTPAVLANGENSAVPSQSTPRRSYQDSPRVKGLSTASPHRSYASPLRCKYCYLSLQPGTVAEHDAQCSLKPLYCQHVNPRTGVPCGYMCRGREMLERHELHCAALRRSRSIGSSGRQTPYKGRSNDVSQRQTPLLPDSLVCHKCNMTFSRSEDLARHRYMCTEEEVLCPLLCGKTLRRREVVEHIKTEALQHPPMNMPSSTEYGGDDPRVVLAVLMNLLLEKTGSDTRKILPSHPVNNDTPMRNNTPRAYPHLTMAGNYTPSVSQRSSMYSILAVSNNQMTPPNSVYARQRRSSSESPGSIMLEPGISMPQARKVLPQPTVQKENGIPSAHKITRQKDEFKVWVRPARGSTSVQSEHSEFILPSTIASTSVSPISKKNEENEEGSINKQEFDNLLHCMEVQENIVNKLNEKYHSKEIQKLNERDHQKVSDEVQSAVDKVDDKNKDIHLRVMRFIDNVGIAPGHVMQVLGKWRALDRHWYDVKFSLYDQVVTNQV
ncbi:uncharacterized protein TM35_000093420 [Trypanosoma theileri]|uniref:C2H2-type domain-containing protein n=1 Tax=Trypanosoma theileri TaxID=67003 RepID=A0A1X0P046_9TRYP|nr:uncharacterized protein TM35_000093420 [Trypanosoma theileri]ORC90292.1 hypothetical protein TM35_000093420 [Trypanosoma theileri]